MDGFGIQITRADIDRWLLQAADYALPRVLQTAGQLILGVIVFVVLRWILNRIDKSFSSKTDTQIDDHFIEAIRRIGSISVTAWVLWRTAHIWGLAGLANLVIAAWIVALSLPLADLVSKLLTVVQVEVASKTETTLDDTALPLLIKAARILTVAGGIVIALSSMNVDIMPFVAGASVLGVAIGFAAKDTLSNLIAGVLLIVDRPFHVGDRIELWTTPRGTGTWGDVIEIGLRATKIRNPDNLIFVIPNNEIMRRDIVNYTASGDNIRLRIPISIAYDANQNRAKEIIRDVALKVDGVLSSPGPQIIIRNFAESAIDLQLRVWIANARDRRAIGDEITDRVKDEFDRLGIEIPYAKRDLYIHSMPASLTTEGSPETPGAVVDSPDDQDQKSERQTKQEKADE